QPDVVSDVGKGEKLYREFGHRRPRSQLTMSFLEDVEKLVSHVEARLARTISLFLVFESFFLLAEQLAMVLGRAVDAFNQAVQDKFVLAGFLFAAVDGTLQCP